MKEINKMNKFAILDMDVEMRTKYKSFIPFSRHIPSNLSLSSIHFHLLQSLPERKKKQQSNNSRLQHTDTLSELENFEMIIAFWLLLIYHLMNMV